MADCYVATDYWEEGYTDQDICEIGPAVEVRQPGGWLPVIYLDRNNRPVGLDELKEQVLEAAPEQPAVEAALEAVAEAQEGRIDVAALEVMAAQFKLLAGLLAQLDDALAMELQARAMEALRMAEDERDVEILLMAI